MHHSRGKNPISCESHSRRELDFSNALHCVRNRKQMKQITKYRTQVHPISRGSTSTNRITRGNQITRGESVDNYTLHRPKPRGEPNPKAGHVTRETSGERQKSRRTSGNLGEIKLQIEPDLILSKRRESGFSCDGHWTHGGSKAGER